MIAFECVDGMQKTDNKAVRILFSTIKELIETCYHGENEIHIPVTSMSITTKEIHELLTFVDICSIKMDFLNIYMDERMKKIFDYFGFRIPFNINDDTIFERMILENSVDLVKYFIGECGFSLHIPACEYACSLQTSDMLELLDQYGYEITQKCTSICIEHNSHKCIEYLQKIGKLMMTTKEALKYGNVTYLRNIRDKTLDLIDDLGGFVIMNCNLEIVKYLCEEKSLGKKFIDDMFYSITSGVPMYGSHDIISCEESERKFEIFKYLNGKFQCSDNIRHIACLNGYGTDNVEHLKWLHSNGFSIRVDAIDSALCYGNLDSLEYIFKNGIVVNDSVLLECSLTLEALTTDDMSLTEVYVKCAKLVIEHVQKDVSISSYVSMINDAIKFIERSKHSEIDIKYFNDLINMSFDINLLINFKEINI